MNEDATNSDSGYSTQSSRKGRTEETIEPSPNKSIDHNTPLPYPSALFTPPLESETNRNPTAYRPIKEKSKASKDTNFTSFKEILSAQIFNLQSFEKLSKTPSLSNPT
ncbi:hypothetical protein K493DRAFT_355309 [Basidiobolus meristosporus CBS 931.73]|uniref:Uncharacterized protein n=1 Tax=Basidiobolus meristosporus CBS 931.73 TaxID=1314790 RepID=A0A1Y1Y120_9FUNG|nr:hypothetical protein K493DRAFT_355309 [Basidiobolus meristosporus CBS 931.73]|eukprot:ORX91700.1 hypothetical protein K493DRAFT_355309 [Basidiobolus meristosporus CBS 931.73]